MSVCNCFCAAKERNVTGLDTWRGVYQDSSVMSVPQQTCRPVSGNVKS